MGIRPIIANSTPINNKIRIQIMPNNELQLYSTYDMRYTKSLDTIAPLTPNKIIFQKQMVKLLLMTE